MNLSFSTICIFIPFLFLHAGFAPDSLVGYKLDEIDTYYIFLTESTLDEHDVEEKELRPNRDYSYQKTGDNSGVFTKPYPGGEPDVFNLTFTSSTGGVITNDSNRAFSLTDLNGGFAPLSIVGHEIEYVGNGETETATFASDGTVSDGEDWTYYTYEKISANVGKVIYTFSNEANPMPEVEILTFSSSTGGTFDWSEYTNSNMNEVSDSGGGTFSFSANNQGYAPDSIAGESITYVDGAESEVATFASDGKVYGDKDGEWTYYTYEKISANVGKVIYTFSNEANPMPEVEILTFSSSTGGTFDWNEYTNSNMNEVSDSGGGTFTLGNAVASLVADQINGSRDLIYLQTPDGPTLIDGVSEMNFEIFLPNQPTVTSAILELDGNQYNLMQGNAPPGFYAQYGFGGGETNELYDVEMSSDDSNWNNYTGSKNFTFSITADGDIFSYTHELPAQLDLPNPPNIYLSGDQNWVVGDENNHYLEIEKLDSFTASWDSFQYDGQYDYILVSLQKQQGDDEVEVFEEVLSSPASTSYLFSGDLLEVDSMYTFYVEFVKVAEAYNPSGFVHADSSDDEPILFTEAISVTAVDLLIVEDISTDPVPVVSDPNGNSVVVQLGDKYQWNSTLDGVTLWSVSGSETEGDWYALTAKFSGGKLIYGFEFADDVSDTGANSVTYEIDANGYIKSLEGDGDYQYYNVVSVENGVIGTIQNDQGVESVADNGINQVDQWFFTTREAAEEYYYSKANPKEWMWFDHYPWVYSEEEQGWLYFYPSGGKLLYYSNKSQVWREFNQ